ncbi:MAG: hypothetical protein WC242_00125 [Candidatus Paceibacterota bacterium]|jgi:hypothetical protein
MIDVIPGLKLIKHNATDIHRPDDPTFPFRLEVSFHPPQLTDRTFVGLSSCSDELIMRGMTKEAIDEFVRRSGFRTHPRLRRLTITGPEGVVEQLP